MSDLILDDSAGMIELDSGELLRATATSGAQVRTALGVITAETLDRLSQDGAPRAVVVLGSGGSGVCGDLLAGLATAGGSVPVVAMRGPVLASWVGPLDLLVAISTSGETPETLLAVDEAARRGVRLIGIGAGGSSLAQRVAAARGQFLPVADAHRLARVSLWSLLTPLMLVADRVGAVRTSRSAANELADRLDSRAIGYGPLTDTVDNPAKALALAMAESTPLILGTSPATAAVAYRFACQLVANAKIPSIASSIPEAITTQVALLDGPLAEPGDLFRDPIEDPPERPRLSMVVLRDGSEPPLVDVQLRALGRLAERHDVPIRTVTSDAAQPLLRLADMLSVVDFAGVYAALALGRDPWLGPAVHEMKARIAEVVQ